MSVFFGGPAQVIIAPPLDLVKAYQHKNADEQDDSDSLLEPYGNHSVMRPSSEAARSICSNDSKEV